VSRTVREKLDGSELLISLALLGEATKEHLLGFHFPGSPIRRIERHLQPLVAQGLIERRARYTFDTQRGVPVPNAHAYRLSARGHELVANDPRYPVQTGTDEYRVRLPNPDTTLVLEHDLLGTEAIAWLVVLARGGGLSGMFLRREQQLDPQSRAPRIDAVLVLHFGGPQVADGAFVWTKNPPVDGEVRWPLALEIDRNTEAISVIRGKAVRYQEALSRQRTHDYWEERYGRVPVIVWIAPTERRLQAIHRVWMEAWPGGTWALATAETLSQGRCWIYQGEYEALSQALMFNASLPNLARVRQSWPADPRGLLTPPPPAPPPPPPRPQLPPPPPPDPEEEAATAAREAVAVHAPPAPRVLTLSFAQKADQPTLMLRPNLAVRAYSTRDASLLWEGRLWLPPVGDPELDLGAQFAGEPLLLHVPALALRCHIPAAATRITLDLAWPARAPNADLDEWPWLTRAGVIWWRQVVRALSTIRDSEGGICALVLLVPSVLALLVVIGLALWTLLTSILMMLWALLVAAGAASWAALIWAAQRVGAAITELIALSESIGGPGVALMLLLAAVGATIWLVVAWEQAISSLRERADIVWRLLAMAVVIWVAGHVIWGQFTGGG